MLGGGATIQQVRLVPVPSAVGGPVDARGAGLFLASSPRVLRAEEVAGHQTETDCDAGSDRTTRQWLPSSALRSTTPEPFSMLNDQTTPSVVARKVGAPPTAAALCTAPQ